MTAKKIGVLGAGAWGTALATAARRAGHDVVLWARDPALATRVNEENANPDYLPGVALDPAIGATADLAEAAQSDALLLVVPAQRLRWIAGLLASHLSGDGAGPPLIICAKGIEQGTGALSPARGGPYPKKLPSANTKSQVSVGSCRAVRAGSEEDRASPNVTVNTRNHFIDTNG